MEVLHALKLSRCCHAILNLVKCLVWLVNGSIGDRALRHVEVALNAALAVSQLLQVVEVLHALKLNSICHATLNLVKCLVELVNGSIGDRALKHVAMALKLAPALS
jgi:hypothetical protein